MHWTPIFSTQTNTRISSSLILATTLSISLCFSIQKWIESNPSSFHSTSFMIILSTTFVMFNSFLMLIWNWQNERISLFFETNRVFIHCYSLFCKKLLAQHVIFMSSSENQQQIIINVFFLTGRLIKKLDENQSDLFICWNAHMI